MLRRTEIEGKKSRAEQKWCHHRMEGEEVVVIVIVEV